MSSVLPYLSLIVHFVQSLFRRKHEQAIVELVIRTGYRCPWQNAYAERWVGTCRRELLNHVVVLDEQHLKRLLSMS